jgi:2-C-methyl-D-erythritol 4-phosphate cytidylyltransferase
VPLAETEIVWTIVVAGGSGARFGKAKQYEPIGGARMIDRSVSTAAAASHGVVVVVPAADVAREVGLHAPHRVVAGGATRSESVRAGLAAVPAEATVVCVHDAARPLVTEVTFAAVVAAVAAGADGAIPGVAVADTIKVVDHTGIVLHTPDRASLMAVQTPQAFRVNVLRAAHGAGAEGTDDAALVESMGGVVIVVPGDVGNRKITHADDLEWARARLSPIDGDPGEW